MDRTNRIGFCQNFKLVSLVPRSIEKVSRCGLPREQQNLAAGKHFANPNGGVNAIQVGHDDIADQHIRLEGPRNFNGLLTCVNGCGLKSALIEDDGKSVGDYALVIGDQHFGLLGSLRHSCI